MAMFVEGRPVVVTGGGSGIGAALAAEAADRGASAVAVADLEVEAAEAVARGIVERGGSARAYGCDVTSPESVGELTDAVARNHGPPALACANAGVMAPLAPLLETPWADAEWTTKVNVLGTLHTLQSFGRLMVAGDQPGWLMATGSEHSVGVPHLHAGAYTASKHAVLAMCDVLRGELPDHVGISLLCPGITSSNLWDSTRHRPERYGGAAESDPMSGMLMEQKGMSASTVAQRAFDGVAAGRFLIPTHYHVRLYAQRRADEMAEAFDLLSEIDTDDYDLTTIVAGLGSEVDG
ncbi:SDR family NAD(P)-dependent oxidoreductase [Candidatus Poriferisocius sp.]|uniref:SDR family NAD(P)-dependent oxidoreductase n=1 Tax=Candidatus Poriferisocius sp. TaxID=3101276 RepID=UPI003B01C98A